MKKSLKGKFQMLLLVFFCIVVLESILILLSVLRPQPMQQMITDIQSIVITFILVQFIYFIAMFYYIPHNYERAYREVFHLINEIVEGKYQIDVDLKTYHQEEEIQSLVKAMHKMMDIILRFDNLKSDKIYEHHQRIQNLLNMLPQGCLIMTVIGEIVYCNQYILDNFPALKENLNIIETLLPEALEDTIKPLMNNSIRNSENLHDTIFHLPTKGKSFLINSSIVRSRKGHPIGAIFIITDYELAEIETVS